MKSIWWKITGGVILGLFVVGIGYDILVRVFGHYSTISEWIHYYAVKYPSIIIGFSFASGYGCCHFFSGETTT